MKKIFSITLLLSFLGFVKGQGSIDISKNYSITNSVAILDINGNEYGYTKNYDHKPTHEDSITFEIEMHSCIKRLTDSVEREVDSYNKYLDSVNENYYKNLKNYAPLILREGKHLFSLHWISWKKFGSVVIKKINNKKYTIKGSQEDDKGNYVTINGFIQPIKRGELKFNGEIITKVSGNNHGESCIKKGEFTFLCSLGRKYWRLQEMENCEGNNLVDYIDIFF